MGAYRHVMIAVLFALGIACSDGTMAAQSATGDLAKSLADGSEAVGLFNRGESELKIALDFKMLGINGPAKLRDLWQHKDLGVEQDSYTASVPKHGVILLKLSK